MPSGGRFAAAGGDLQAENRFFAASVTKLIVTIMVMRLVEQGRMALDDAWCDTFSPKLPAICTS